MGWLKVVTLLLGLADKLVARYDKHKLVELGVDRQLRSTLKNTLELVERGRRVDEAWDNLSDTQRRSLRDRYKADAE